MTSLISSLSTSSRPASELGRPAGAECRRPVSTAPRCQSHAPELSRRTLLGASAGLSTLLTLPWAQQARAEGDTDTYYGLAAPPSSYGAALKPKGDNSNAKYAFDYPTGWKVDTIGKNEKGMQGIDGRVRNTKTKGQAAYVVTFGRAGEDNKSFKLGDAETTLQGFAGADYDLQDALTESQQKSSSKRQQNGQEFYDYEVVGPAFTYLATVTQKAGKVYALFVKSPSKLWSSDEPKLRNITQTFRTL